MNMLMRKIISLCGVLYLLFAAPLAAASEDAIPIHHRFQLLWSLQGEDNRVYILGSVNLLPERERRLPDVVQAAYKTSDLIVFESDLFLIGSVDFEAAELSMARYPAGQTIADEMPRDLMVEAREWTEHLGLPMSVLERYRPWFFAQVLATAKFARDGFPLDDGVDTRMYDKAVRDQKLTSGLTPPDDHLATFAQMERAENIDFLRTALADLKDTQGQVARILDIYRNANLPLLRDLTATMRTDTPRLYERLIAERNRSWLPKFEEYLQRPSNVLVIVGAMHLVGEDGLLALFREQGWEPSVPVYRGFRPPE